jgi:hypothetical protein
VKRGSTLGWSAAVLLVVAVAAVLHFCKWVDIDRRVGYSEAAQRKPYLAAEMFLARLGIKTEVADGLTLLDALPPPHTTLLIAGSRQALGQRRLDGLVSWLQGGGHLIVVASSYWDDKTNSSGDELLDRYDVRLHKTPEAPRNPTRRRRSVVELGQSTCDASGSLATVSFRGDAQPSYAAFPGDDFLEYGGDDEAGSAANDFGPQLLQIRVGEGRLTAITSTNLWRNRMIGCYDHAHVLRLLVQGSERLYWLFNTEMPPLPLLLWERFPTALLLLAVCVGAWLWQVVPRRVPAAARSQQPRRRVREHVTGIARFMWQQRRGDLLWAAARDAADPRIRDEAWLAQQAPRIGTSPEALLELAKQPPPQREARFVGALRALQQLRKSR